MPSRPSTGNPPILADAYRMVFEQTADACLLLDATGIVLDANPAAAHHLGYTCAELSGKPTRALLDPASADSFSPGLAQAQREGSAAFAAVHVHRNGTPIPVDIQLKRFGQALIVAICRPIAGTRQCDIGYQKSSRPRARVTGW